MNWTMKDAWAAYSSGFINSNKHNPEFLFSTINQLIEPSLPAIPALSSNAFENFFSFSVCKIQPFCFTALVCSYSPKDHFNLYCSSDASLLQSLQYSSLKIPEIPLSRVKSKLHLYYKLLSHIQVLAWLFQNCCVQPLKKPTLNRGHLENDRPISKQPFYLKFLKHPF